MTNQSASHQRQRILTYLQAQGSATTIQLRHELDVLAPAPRIFELRHNHNANIVTSWDEAENPEGGTHRVARYTLKAGKYKEGKK